MVGQNIDVVSPLIYIYKYIYIYIYPWSEGNTNLTQVALPKNTKVEKKNFKKIKINGYDRI